MNNTRQTQRGLFKNSKTMLRRLINYLQHSRTELQKVSWPSRQTTITHTLLVIAFSVGMAVFLGGIDYVFNIAAETLITR